MSVHSNPNDSIRLALCHTRHGRYGIDVMRIQNVLRARELQEGATGDGAVGHVRLGGESVPVYSLAHLLGEDERPTASGQRIAVVSVGSAVRALLVDTISSIIQSDRSSLGLLPPLALRGGRSCYQGVAADENSNLVLVLDADGMFPGCFPASRDVDGVRGGISVKSFAPAGDFRTARDRRKQLVLFSVDDMVQAGGRVLFGLSISQVPEIIDLPAITPVPSAPAHILGIVRWRQWVVPVVDLAVRMGVRREPVTISDGHRLLITRYGIAENRGELSGVLVGSDIHMRRLPLRHYACRGDVPVDPYFVLGAVELDRATLVVPDLRKLFQ